MSYPRKRLHIEPHGGPSELHSVVWVSGFAGKLSWRTPLLPTAEARHEVHQANTGLVIAERERGAAKMAGNRDATVKVTVHLLEQHVAVDGDRSNHEQPQRHRQHKHHADDPGGIMNG